MKHVLPQSRHFVLACALVVAGCGSSSSGTTATAVSYPGGLPVSATVLPNGQNNGDSALWYVVSGLTPAARYTGAASTTSNATFSLSVQTALNTTASNELCFYSDMMMPDQQHVMCDFTAPAGPTYFCVANEDNKPIPFSLDIAAN